MDSVIASSGLTRRFGPTTAVRDLNLDIGRGEIYGLLGLNGAGKTTTFRMLLGMIRPSSGEARLFGTRVGPGCGAVWARVGYLVETPHAYPQLTVLENLEVARRLRRVPDRRAVDRVLELVKLGEYAERRTGNLSRGNAQRLGIAKAMLHEPELLLLDEPANGLDPAGIVETRELLRDLAADRSVTVLISSHILAEVARLATRIGIIHRGMLVEEFEASGLAARLRRRAVVDARDRPAAQAALSRAGYRFAPAEDGRLCSDEASAAERPEELARILVRAGVPPTLLAVEQEGLEEHFLRTVSDKPEAS
ncbi:MAG: ABC transporter ATP-binding protein [candidate division WOR-3 bacterium]|nr:MAG: ABC transporter ATP-binding protein [candidate division WOR-3 bacterium]